MSVDGSNTGPFGIPPGGPYFVFPVTGTIQRQDNKILATGMAASGWIGFPTMAAAENYAHNDSIASKANSAIDSATGWTTKLVAAVTNPQLWLRVAEVVIGVALIVVGALRLSGKQEQVKQAAVTAGKALALA